MNQIVFSVIDGYDQHSEMKGSKYIMYSGRSFGVEEIRLDTKEVLNKGDHVRYKNYLTKVIERVYRPEEDDFTFLCGCIYTGRLE
jgi:hypothetical protein